jgi:PIN domain nuclease of toxin-antitoxin system
LLVDTHTLIWAVDDPARLGMRAAQELRNLSNDVLVSVATVWEISIKYGLGKLALSKAFRDWIVEALNRLDASLLPITIDSADAQSSLPHHHRDPFDRMLVAHSAVEGVPLVSGDAAFDAYGIPRIWWAGPGGTFPGHFRRPISLPADSTPSPKPTANAPKINADCGIVSSQISTRIFCDSRF